MSNANDILNGNAEASTPVDLLANEDLLGLTDLTKRLPKINGKRPSVCTLWRWCLKGMHGVRLEHIRRGRTIATSLEAVDRFSSQLARARVEQLEMDHERAGGGSHRPTSPASRRRQIEAARRRLEQAGI